MKNFGKAKRIWEQAIQIAKKEIKPGKKLLDAAEKIENFIYKNNAKPAFPVNISINHIAAHYTPSINEQSVFKEDSLVKVDVGVKFEDKIYDGAISIDLSKKHDELVKTAEKAMQAGIKATKPGVKIFEISEAIASIIEASGFNVVKNLTGHKIEATKLHAGTIPNYRNKIKEEIKAGEIIAIEVFVTNGSGWVKESKPVEIFEFASRKPVRLWEGKKILELAEKEFGKLPFAKRWLKKIPSAKLDLALSQLQAVGAIRAYPVLKEISNGIVAQAERSILAR